MFNEVKLVQIYDTLCRMILYIIQKGENEAQLPHAAYACSKPVVLPGGPWRESRSHIVKYFSKPLIQ